MTGWECPKCGQVYGPFVNECANCRPKAVTSNSSGVCPVCGESLYSPGGTACGHNHYGSYSVTASSSVQEPRP